MRAVSSASQPFSIIHSLSVLLEPFKSLRAHAFRVVPQQTQAPPLELNLFRSRCVGFVEPVDLYVWAGMTAPSIVDYPCTVDNWGKNNRHQNEHTLAVSKLLVNLLAVTLVSFLLRWDFISLNSVSTDFRR